MSASVKSLYYTQHDEERFILDAVQSISHGRLLDIGAFDGIWSSNTLALIERGWSGVLIEPSIDAFKNLLKRHGENPHITLVQAAIGVLSGPVEFWDSPAGVATTERSNFDKWKTAIPGTFSTPYWIPQLSVVDLLAKFPGPYDVVSIDTEGTSVAVLSAVVYVLDHCNHIPPKVIVVEHDGKVNECLSIVGADYRVIDRNGENLVLAR